MSVHADVSLSAPTSVPSATSLQPGDLAPSFSASAFAHQNSSFVVPLVTVPQGQIGYVYARDGVPLPPSQTLGRVVECANFQDARAFLARTGEESEFGQRGRHFCRAK